MYPVGSVVCTYLLQNPNSDPRPTFLFWARDVGPVALLRGANRPLLTKLVESEVHIETAEEPRDRLEIDFRDGLCL